MEPQCANYSYLIPKSNKSIWKRDAHKDHRKGIEDHSLIVSSSSSKRNSKNWQTLQSFFFFFFSLLQSFTIFEIEAATVNCTILFLSKMFAQAAVVAFFNNLAEGGLQACLLVGFLLKMCRVTRM